MKRNDGYGHDHEQEDKNENGAGHSHAHEGEDGHSHDHGDEGDCGCGHDHGSGAASGKKQLAVLFAGGFLFVAGLVVQHVIAPEIIVTLAIFLVAYLILGGKIVMLAAKNIARGQVFDENFLMSIATLGAFAIGEFPEAVAVMLFYQTGMYFQDFAVRRSRKSIADLMDIRPDYANLIRDGKIVTVAPEAVQIGDRILVKPGEKIPLDGVVVEGEAMLDTRALTGESVPRKVRPSDDALSGCIALNGALTIEVTKSFGQSTVAQIIELVENASAKKAPTEKFITKFARYYTPVVVIAAALIAAVPPLLFGGLWADWIYRGLVFLVISCPCALVISIPLGFFGGIGGASKRGVLVKGGHYLEALNAVDVVVFDKTGTLTKGVFEVTSVEPAVGFSQSELLALAAQAEFFSNHPIALSISKAHGAPINPAMLSDYQEIAGQGVSVRAGGNVIRAGNEKLMAASGISFVESAGLGTKAYIAVDQIFAGCVVISDEVKPDSRATIAALKAKGIRKVAMLTGDNPQIAEAVAKELGVDEVYAGLLPQQKVEMLENLAQHKRPKGKLAFVGDGINDAPVLARADVGIAMGGLGSDAAIEAADVVLMTDEPAKLLEAMDAVRFTKRIVWQNIVIALGVKAAFLALGALGVASMWAAVFADVGVALIAVLNAMRAGKRIEN